MTLGERLATLRNTKNMTQDELAKSLKIGKSTLGMYETNKREPDLNTIALLAAYFEVSIDWLITGKSFDESRTSKESSIMASNIIKHIRNAEADYDVDLLNDSLVNEIIHQFIFNLAKLKAKVHHS
ncbi:helix-turn-helix domain-containing protein [Paenibacillus sp. LS1]|uniref:helix-turn-helix domain-containing protein n=1 Tax=Paenibacillus sp. LS1 TaxID=2992120 RepID=UPI00222FEC96|nr:helix-turn-helix transcriptional regulator [Paenibacillus sp. LS1]MCW3793853.1 helix-turn-helix domain-containing protein [Paenibacillus sp. LS1]